MKGKIKWYNSRKGYGFIEGEDKKDIFVHRNSIRQTFIRKMVIWSNIPDYYQI